MVDPPATTTVPGVFVSSGTAAEEVEVGTPPAGEFPGEEAGEEPDEPPEGEAG